MFQSLSYIFKTKTQGSTSSINLPTSFHLHPTSNALIPQPTSLNIILKCWRQRKHERHTIGSYDTNVRSALSVLDISARLIPLKRDAPGARGAGEK